MNRLGAAFTQDEITELYTGADLTQSGHLNFNEFLIVLAIGFVLHVRVTISSQ